MIKFGRKVHWTDARKKPTIPGDTGALRIRVPEDEEVIEYFFRKYAVLLPKGDDNPDTGLRVFEKYSITSSSSGHSYAYSARVAKCRRFLRIYPMNFPMNLIAA